MTIKYSTYGLILQVICIGLLFAHNTNAQYSSVKETRLNTAFNNKTIQEAFNLIESNTDFTFYYNKKKLDKKLKLNIPQKTGRSVADVLLEISRQANLKFKQVNNNISVTKMKPQSGPSKNATLEVVVLADVQISGKITDENGQGLPGATVVQKGVTNGTTTDLEGNYKLTLPEDAIVAISFVGYKTVEMPVGTQSTIDVQMEVDAETLSEVVVIGYGSRKKEDLTGSVGQISSSDITKTPALSPQLAMQGRMPGVLVSPGSGDPNARPTIRIRGVGTTGNNDPLYVIDGVAITEFGQEPVYSFSQAAASDIRTSQNIFNMINPNDIESISVLKDASAAAIYGVRAANGVVIITTKKGKKGRPKVSFDMSTGIQNNPGKFEMLNTSEFAAIHQEMYANNTGSSGALESTFDPNSPDYLGNSQTYDWQDAVLNKNASIQNYYVSVSGGNDGSNFYVGAGYSKTESPLVNNAQERYSVTLNSDHNINDWLKVGETFRLGYIDATNQRGGGLEYRRYAPWQPIYGDGPNGYAPVNSFNDDGSIDQNRIYGLATRSNGLGSASVNASDYTILRNMGSAYIEAQPLKGLRVKASLQADFSISRHTRWTGRESHAFNTDATDNNANSYNERHLRNTNLTGEITINYDKSFGDHNFIWTLNAMDQNYTGDILGASNNNLPSDLVEFRRIYEANEDQRTGQSKESYGLQGYMGRMSYNYDSRYYVDVTIRRDGSSKFAKAYRWGTFPSAAVAWRISEEPFMESVGFINNLKLRGGWGKLGNQSIESYQFLSTVSIESSYLLGAYTGADYGPGAGTKHQGAHLPKVPVEDLTWEVGESTTVAFDGVFMNNKLDMTFEYYNRLTTDILQTVSIPMVIGAIQSPTQNIASVRNSGIELSANYRMNFGDLDLSVGGNITTINNNVEELYEGAPLGGNTDRIEEGRPLNYLYGYQMLGIFQSTQEVTDFLATTSDPGNETQKSPGDIKFADIHGDPTEEGQVRSIGADGTINERDQTYLGSTIPSHFYGANINANYKGFDLYVFFQGIGGVQKVNSARADGEGMNSVNSGHNLWRTTLDRWTPENPSTTMPRAIDEDPSGNTRFSSRFVEDAGFMRLKTIQLGYTLPNTLMSKIGASNFRLYVSATNLSTFTSWTGVDPENDDVPLPRVFTFGLNATF